MSPLQTVLHTVQCRRITALLVPADDARPVQLVQVQDRAQVFSEAIGGGLLDELSAQLPGGEVVAFYLDEDRFAAGLPDNPRAARLARSLNLAQRVPVAQLRGDLLVTGLDMTRTDTSVPVTVLAAAQHAGMFETDR